MVIVFCNTDCCNTIDVTVLFNCLSNKPLFATVVKFAVIAVNSCICACDCATVAACKILDETVQLIVMDGDEGITEITLIRLIEIPKSVATFATKLFWKKALKDIVILIVTCTIGTITNL